MNKRRSDQQRRLIAEQAAEWLVLMQPGKMSVKERTQFIDWLRQSPAHVAEMLRIGRIDHALADHTAWREIAADGKTDADNVVMLSDFQVSPVVQKPDRVAVTRWAAAAGVAMAAILGAWLFLSPGQTVIRTQLGERREVTLADGSVINVAPSTELRVRLEAKQRLIKLTHGQAFFHVAKDASRPFIVDAGDTSVRAVGTAFDVVRSGDGVTVTVVEGRVAVVRGSSAVTRVIGPEPAQLADVYLAANEQVVVTPSVAELPVREVNGAAEVAWKEGNLVFNDETVADVVRRFNLYNRAQIQILDQGLAARRVSGVFKTSDPESFIAFVRSTTNDVSHEQDLIRLEAPAQ